MAKKIKSIERNGRRRVKKNIDDSIKQDTKNHATGQQQVLKNTITIKLGDEKRKKPRKDKKKSPESGKKKKLVEAIRASLLRFSQLKQQAMQHKIELPASIGETPLEAAKLDTVVELEQLLQSINLKSQQIEQLIAAGAKPQQKPNIFLEGAGVGDPRMPQIRPALPVQPIPTPAGTTPAPHVVIHTGGGGDPATEKPKVIIPPRTLTPEEKIILQSLDKHSQAILEMLQKKYEAGSISKEDYEKAIDGYIEKMKAVQAGKKGEGTKSPAEVEKETTKVSLAALGDFGVIKDEYNAFIKSLTDLKEDHGYGHGDWRFAMGNIDDPADPPKIVIEPDRVERLNEEKEKLRDDVINFAAKHKRVIDANKEQFSELDAMEKDLQTPLPELLPLKNSHIQRYITNQHAVVTFLTEPKGKTPLTSDAHFTQLYLELGKRIKKLQFDVEHGMPTVDFQREKQETLDKLKLLSSESQANNTDWWKRNESQLQTLEGALSRITQPSLVGDRVFSAPFVQGMDWLNAIMEGAATVPPMGTMGNRPHLKDHLEMFNTPNHDIRRLIALPYRAKAEKEAFASDLRHTLNNILSNVVFDGLDTRNPSPNTIGDYLDYDRGGRGSVVEDPYKHSIHKGMQAFPSTPQPQSPRPPSHEPTPKPAQGAMGEEGVNPMPHVVDLLQFFS
jgi:hypothetical protein